LQEVQCLPRDAYHNTESYSSKLSHDYTKFYGADQRNFLQISYTFDIHQLRAEWWWLYYQL